MGLIVSTVVLGTQGFRAIPGERGGSPEFLDALYRAISLLAIQTGAVPASGNRPLQWARWLGMAFWASALIVVAVRLFREWVHRGLVRVLARNHVIVAGLGPAGLRLVEALLGRGDTVVVIEPDRNHPAVDQCRRAGAIVLFGETDDARMLVAAKLRVARVLLALFPDERECVRTATRAYQLLHDAKANANARRPPVRCVLRVAEPGMLDVVRGHAIKTDPADRFELEILNAHEIAATTMVREAVANSRDSRLRKLMVVGLGTHHRLGEMVVLRAVKDHVIACAGRVDEKLEVHVFDRHARRWLDSFRSRHPKVDGVCTITAHPCWARKLGSSKLKGKIDVDAAFVCIADEGHATAVAVMLRREVLAPDRPIMVRVQHSRSGYGELLGQERSGWGENLHAVGLEDALFDPDTATRPEVEMRAQTIHQDHRLNRLDESRTATGKTLQHILKEPANRPWQHLDEGDRQQNRDLARLYDEYLAMTLDGKRTRYRRVFAPIPLDQADGIGLSPAELEALSRVEHARWLKLKRSQGYTLGEDREQMQNPYLDEWDNLTPEKQAYSSRYVLRIPRILAMADYRIVPIVEPSPGPDSPRPGAGSGPARA